jgi:hypothetical protein
MGGVSRGGAKLVDGSLHFRGILSLDNNGGFSSIRSGGPIRDLSAAQVIVRFTPLRHRNLIFSVKQSGVPLGGVAVGLTAPLIAVSLGWQWSVLPAIVVAMSGCSSENCSASFAIELPRDRQRSAARRAARIDK